MSRLGVKRVLLVTLLMANGACGAGKIAFFVHRNAGEKALASADLARAHATLQAAAAWRPGDAPTRILQARLVRLALANGLPVPGVEGRGDMGSLAAGVHDLARAISLNPADAWAWFNLAEVYGAHQRGRLRRERLRGAGAAATRNERPAGPGDGPVQPEEAVVAAATLKALEREPSFYFYHDFLARLYAEKGLEEEAWREIRASFELMPLPSAHRLLAAAGLVEPYAGAALEGMAAAGDRAGFHPAVVVRSRAELLRSVGRREEAMQAFLELRGFGGTELEAECDLAVALLLFQAGRYGESIPLLDRVLGTGAPARITDQAVYYRGVARREIGDDAGALADFQEYRRRRPESARPILIVARHLERTGALEEAERLYRVGARRFPREVSFHRALAVLLERQRRWLEAMEAAKHLETLDPDNQQTEELLHRIRRGAAESGL